MNDDCLFCKIVRGDIPSHRFYEDDETVAFMDINPSVDGHCLVVPKEHSDSIFDMSQAAAEAVMRAARKIAPALRDAVDAEGMNLLQANGAVAGQTVFHFHLHLVPRHGEDGFGPLTPHRPKSASSDELAELAQKIKGQLGG